MTKRLLNYTKTKREEAVTMAKGRKKIRPALSPEARENQMISLAVDLAEKQLIEGTASSQVITHFLKLGTTKAELEKEKLRKENKLLEARASAIEDSKEYKILVEDAIRAIKGYQGLSDTEEYEDE